MRLSLKCHPDSLTSTIGAVDVELECSETGILDLTYSILSGANEVAFLDETASGRADYLWQQTCFEAFIKPEGEESYLEFNLSPSTEWAVYAFDSHRKGMKDITLKTDPVVRGEFERGCYKLSARLNLAGQGLFDNGAHAFLGLSAIIEEKGGHKSLWALTHPAGNPDFHHWDCFAQKLEAPKAI